MGGTGGTGGWCTYPVGQQQAQLATYNGSCYTPYTTSANGMNGIRSLEYAAQPGM